jgi:hypothetical protein
LPGILFKEVLMGFGFNDTGEEEKDTGPNVEYKLTDKLTYLEWSELSTDMRVQSVLTGTKGTILSLEEEWFMIHILWDNGSFSQTSHKYYDKVIVI